MRSLLRPQTVLLVFALLALTGCGAQLKYDKTTTLDELGLETIYFDEPVVEKATVKLKSPGVEINAYLVLQSNLESAQRALRRGEQPKDIMTKKEKFEETTLEAAPGKKPFALILTGRGKRAEVSVQATGK
jgi:hypothetical protein